MEEGKLMQRKEAVRLVSRALSIIDSVFALYETAYLPERLFSCLHCTNEWRSPRAPGASTYLPALDRVSVGFLFVRIAIYLPLAVVFWHWAPWVRPAPLPEAET